MEFSEGFLQAGRPHQRLEYPPDVFLFLRVQGGLFLLNGIAWLKFRVIIFYLFRFRAACLWSGSLNFNQVGTMVNSEAPAAIMKGSCGLKRSHS